MIALGAARGIATDASADTYIAPPDALYRDVVLPNRDFFGAFLTAAALAIGLGLILGVASRLAAVGGLLLLTPIWVMLWDRGHYLWTYPVLGFDKHLAARFHGRCPF